MLNAVNTQPQSKEGGRGGGEHAEREQAGPNVRDPEKQLTIQTVVNLQFLEPRVSSLFDHCNYCNKQRMTENNLGPSEGFWLNK